MAGLAPAVVGITARIGGLGGFVEGIGQMNAGMLGFRTSAQAAGTGLQTATANFTQFNTAVTGIGNSLGAIGQTFNTFTAPIRALGGVFAEVAGVAVSFTAQLVGSLAAVAGALTAVGAAAAIGLGALGSAVAGGLAATISIAAAFHQELVDLGAVARAEPEAIGQVEEAVKRMATQFAISIPEIQRTALELVKAGIPADQVASGVLKITLALQQLSKGELSAEQAGQGIGALLKLFDKQFQDSGQSVEQFSLRIANAVAAVANNTRASISEVISGVNKLAPTLAARGADLESVFTSLNVVLEKGIRGEEAGTGLRNLFNFLINPSKEALATIKELKLQDISPFDLDGNIRPALDTLRSIQKVFGEQSGRLTPADLTKAESQIFQTRAGTIAAIIRSAGPEGIEKFLEKLSKTNVVDQAGEQLGTLTRQFTLLTNAIKLAAVGFGENFLGTLTDAGKKINAFLAGNELVPRVSQAGSAAGAGVLSLLTGQGAGASFAGVTQQFGEEAGNAFALIFNQVEALRGPITKLLDDLGHLKDTFLGIVFPEGPGAAIAKFGEITSGVVQVADRFVNFLSENLPTAAKNFDSLQIEAGKFLDKINGIVTDGKGLDVLPGIWESLQPLIGSVRGLLDDVATSSATFVRALIDNRDPIIGFFTILVDLVGKLDKLMLGVATGMANFAGDVGKLNSALGGLSGVFGAILDPGQVPRRIGGNVGAGIVAGRQPTVVTPATELSEQARDRDAQANAWGGEERALAALSEADRENQVEVNALAHAYAGLATRQEQAAAAAAAANTSQGAIPLDQVKIAAAAKQAEDAAQRMRDRVNEATEDIARQGEQNFRQFERTLQGIDQRLQDTMESIEEQAQDSLTNLIESFQQNKKQLQESFQIQQDQQGLQVALQQRQEDDRRSFDQMMEDRRTLRAHDREDNDTVASRQSDDSLRRFQQGLDKEDRAHQISIDRQNRDFERGQEAKARIFTRNQENLSRTFSEGFENANLTRGRGQEDTQRGKDLAKDLAKAKTAEDKKAIQERFDEETTGLRDRRQIENGEINIRRQQETATINFRRQQENDLITFRQNQEQVGVDRRNLQTEDEVDYRIGQELRFLGERRLAEDVERTRRRLLDQQELLERRREEANEIIPFGRGQQQEQRDQQFAFAEAALQRALAENEQRFNKGLTQQEQTITRGVNRAQRTANRETAAAAQQRIDQEIAGASKIADIETDLNRQRQREIEKLRIEDPLLQSPKSQEALASLSGISGAIFRAQALSEAQRILSAGRAQSAIDEATGKMAALRTTSDSALNGLLRDISELRSLSDTPGGNAITITTIISTPQADRLAAAIEALTTKIENVKPGINIGTLEQNLESPDDAGPAVVSLGTIAGAV